MLYWLRAWLLVLYLLAASATVWASQLRAKLMDTDHEGRPFEVSCSLHIFLNGIYTLAKRDLFFFFLSYHSKLCLYHTIRILRVSAWFVFMKLNSLGCENNIQWFTNLNAYFWYFFVYHPFSLTWMSWNFENSCFSGFCFSRVDKNILYRIFYMLGESGCDVLELGSVVWSLWQKAVVENLTCSRHWFRGWLETPSPFCQWNDRQV